MLTADRLYDYASKYARRYERAGKGTKWPTFRRIAKSLRCSYQAIEDAANDYHGDGYMGVGVGVQIFAHGYAMHKNEGDYVVEAYGDSEKEKKEGTSS